MKAAFDKNVGFIQAVGIDDEEIYAELIKIDPEVNVEDFDIRPITPRLAQYVRDHGTPDRFVRLEDGTIDIDIEEEELD